MGRKTVVPPALADALTEDKPRVARVVTALANPDADSVSASPVPPDSVSVPSVLDNAHIPAPAEIEALAQKDVETLTDEIIALEKHGVGVLLEIGKRLIAAKEKLSHGEWLPWLERINITPRYAQRYMRLAREWTNATTLTYLGMSKALALLSLPEETRENFVTESHVVDGVEMSVNDMSVRELNEAIQARKDAEARLADAEELLHESESAYEETRKQLLQTGHDLQVAQYQAEQDKAKFDAERAQHFEMVDKLTAELTELKAKPVDVAIEKVVDEESIERAKKAVRDELEGKVKSAESAADTARQSLSKVRADLDKTNRDAEAARINEKVAKEEAEKARQDAEAARKDAGAVRVERDNARQELADARAELERVRAEAQKAASLADKDLSLFSVLFEQTQSAVNQMRGVLLKQPPDKQAGLKKALNDLADAVRKAAE